MTKVWGDDGDAVLSRYNRGCPPYQINHDRFGSSNILDGSRIQQNSRGYSVPSHDQKSDIDSEEHGKGNPRRRIPVACGRCRKRKIRCSGPQGDTGCQNCKTAGNENCQFNRVQSEEAIFIKDGGYSYDIAAARNLQLRTSHNILYSGSSPGYNQVSPMIPLGSQVSYRQLALSEYPLPPKSTYYGAPYGMEFGDDAVEYSMNNHPYPDHLSLAANFGPHSQPRAWASVQHPKQTYYDTDSASNYSGVSIPYQHTMSYPIRSSLSNESFSLSGMASSLPITSTERILPMPAAPRASFSRSHEGLPYPTTIASPQTVKAMHTLASLPNTASTSESVPYNIPLSTSPENTIPSTYASVPQRGEYQQVQQQQQQQPATAHHQQELYPTASTNVDWTGVATGAEPGLKPHGSHADLYNYTTSSSTSSSRKISQGNSANVSGTLANGQIYVPYQSPHDLTGRSLNLDVAVSNEGHRGSVSSLRAG